MISVSIPRFINIVQEEDKKTLFEQYKLLLDSINKLNENRETANNFWIGINGAFIATAAYVRDATKIGGEQKIVFIFILIFLGFTLTCFWLSSLKTIKNNIEIRNQMVFELEKYFPSQIFTQTMEKKTGEQEGWGAIIFNEMFVPLTFLISYLLFAVFLYFFPQTIISC